MTPEFLQEARQLATQHGALLIFDEVQTGMGRTGTWFHYQQHGILPDVVTVAKGLGGGMPIGACLARGAAADLFEPGDHGSTFGGSAISCAAGLAVIDTIEHQDLMENAKRVGAYFAEGLRSLGGPISEVRGSGLMLAAGLDRPIARDVVAACLDRKLIINATDEFTLRFVPPLILKEEQVDKALNVLAEVLEVPAPKLAATIHVRRPTPLHDVLAMDDVSSSESAELLAHAAYLKERRRLAPSVIQPVEGRTIALVFEKPSLRTRVSFEAAIRELGGDAIHLGKQDIGMGSREAIKDVSENLSRWCSAIVARLYWQKDLQTMAEFADVPVINALTEMEHPCQALADMLTVQENFGEQKVKITYVGDGNNVARSLAKLATGLGYPFAICGPENFRLEPIEGMVQTSDLEEGLSNARVVYTDVWVSMGDEHEQEHRLKIFGEYQVNQRLMEMAAPDAIFMHCLPARRGYEVTDSVIDGVQSRVNDQAENRLHVQKALLMRVLGLGS